MSFLQTKNITIFEILSVYFNYYQNGDNYCPKHQHLGIKQIIISLGSSRNLYVNNNKYNLTDGSIFLFGSEYHEIKKQKNITNPRISIVIFYN